MEKKIVEKLIRINTNFYNKVGPSFDESRNYFWKGWEQLLPYIENNKNVLDVGCGNGRFGEFVKDKNISYRGIDNNEFLLTQAINKKIPKSQFDLIDLFSNFQIDTYYQYICMFGVIHHIPSFSLRVKLLKTLSGYLSPNGILFISVWEFIYIPKFNEKIIPFKTIGIENFQIETGDYLYKWQRGEEATRYCHFLDRSEITKIINECNLKLIYEFKADSFNKYLILKKI